MTPVKVLKAVLTAKEYRRRRYFLVKPMTAIKLFLGEEGFDLSKPYSEYYDTTTGTEIFEQVVVQSDLDEGDHHGK